MKRNFWIILIVLISLLLTGCGAGPKSSSNPDNTPKIEKPQSSGMKLNKNEGSGVSMEDLHAALAEESYLHSHKHTEIKKVVVIEREIFEDEGTDSIYVKLYATMSGLDIMSIHEIRYVFQNGEWILWGVFAHNEEEWELDIPSEKTLCEDLTQALQEDYPGVTVKAVKVTDAESDHFVFSLYLEAVVTLADCAPGEYETELVYHTSENGWVYHDYDWAGPWPQA